MAMWALVAVTVYAGAYGMFRCWRLFHTDFLESYRQEIAVRQKQVDSMDGIAAIRGREVTRMVADPVTGSTTSNGSFYGRPADPGWCGCPVARSFGGGPITVLHDQGCPEAPRIRGESARHGSDLDNVIAGPARHPNGQVRLPRVTSYGQRGGITAGVVLDPTGAQPDVLMPGRRTLPLLESDGETAWPDRHPHLWVLLRSVLPRGWFRALVLHFVPDDSPLPPPGSLHEAAERAAFYARGASPRRDRPSNTESR
jgi:hypothetical protein